MSLALLAIRVAGALAVLAAMGFWGWKAFHWSDRLELIDDFSANAPIRSFMLQSEGVHVEGEGLAVPGGAIARREYGLTYGKGHQLVLEVEPVEGAPARYGAWVSRGDLRIALDTTQFGDEPIPLSHLLGPGNVRLELWIENAAPEGSPPQVLLKELKVIRQGRGGSPDIATLVFYGTTGAVFWLFVAMFAIPTGIEQLLDGRAESAASSRSLQALLLLGVVVASAWMLGQPEWDALKDYDDRAAIGNAAMLLDTEFDQSNVYFRSRVRPGFPGIVQPILALSPHRLSGYWSNASDNFRQDWLIYDQGGWDYGLFTYPHLTLMSQGLALIMVLGLFGIYRRLEVLPAMALGATLLGTIYYGRSLTIAITQTVNLCINVLVVWHYLSAGEHPAWKHRAATGFLLGLAFLVKETAATTVIALGLFTLIDGPMKGAGRRIAGSIPIWGAAALWPAVYFGLIAEGGFGELFTNFDNHLAQDEKNPFEPLTLSSGVRDMTVVFSALGLGAVALGLAAASAERFRSRADRFMACWAVGCLPVFTLPYIFPRFLKYFIPSFAYWSVRVAGFPRRKSKPGENA